MRYLTLFLCITLLFSSCEEDDICVDGKSPQLHIKFENVFEADSARMDSIIIFRENDLGEFELAEAQAKANGIDSIKVSLPIIDVSQAKFILTKRRYETAYYDTLTLDYTRDIVFGSTACGYKVNYNDVYYDITENFFVNKDILDINITNETYPHILLYY